jgi:hypothetical protein
MAPAYLLCYSCICTLSMLSRGRELAADTIVVTVRIPVALQQQLDAMALKSPQLKVATEP